MRCGTQVKFNNHQNQQAVKLFWPILPLALFSLGLTAQVFDVQTIKYTGTDDKRIVLVYLSDGYQTSELDKFITDATHFTTKMFSTSPFSEYSNYFNVYAIKVPSNESGVDHPATATDVDESAASPSFKDTYFNATFDAFDIHRLLYYEIDGNATNNTETKILSVLADHVPNYDQALLISNTNEYGGTGGTFPISYNGFWGADVNIHEIGHSLFNLKDEYYPGDALAAEAINMTQNSDPNTIKWKNWIGTNGIGIHQYFDFQGNPKDWYKPRNGACKMESLDKPFCAVCKEGIVEKIHDLLSPVDGFMPDNSNNIENPTFPLDFELSLINPNPNTLERTWFLNGVSFANNVDGVSVLENDLINGTNTLSAIVSDNSPLLKVNNHGTLHVNHVTWTINYAALGIKDITSNHQSYSINIYPNPIKDIAVFNIESDKTYNLNVKLASLDGKIVKSFKIINAVAYTLNLGGLSPGVYISNFYDGNVLVATKKIIKK